LVSKLDLEAVLAQVLAAARELTGARYAALGVLDAAKVELERFLTLGVDEATRLEIGPLPRGHGVLGELIRHPEPLRLTDVRQHPRSYGFPAGHPPMETFLGVPVLIRGEAWGNLYLAEKTEGERFSEADEQALVVLAGWAAVAIDNARLYESAERRRVELERAVRGLQATVSLSREVGGETALERVLELVAKRGRALVDAGNLLILLPSRDGLAVTEAAGEIAEGVRGRELAVKFEPQAKPAGVRDESLERRVLEALGVEFSASLLVTLARRGRREGFLLALDRVGESTQFSADDELLLSSFAASAATAVAMVQTVESEKLNLSIDSSERERRRWARELHDETLQQLGAIRVMHDIALQRGDQVTMRKALERASDQLEETIAGLEGLITELRPAALDQLGVAAALEALVERTQGTTDLQITAEVDVDSGENGRLTPELESTAYRLVQEALNNVVKHAGAQKARISMTLEGDWLDLQVEDDGRGFDPGGVPQRFGLIGMKERVAGARGELEVKSAPGAGTQLAARLPLVMPQDAC
jgi:signal transduction histidine kinase